MLGINKGVTLFLPANENHEFDRHTLGHTDHVAAEAKGDEDRLRGAQWQQQKCTRCQWLRNSQI